MTVAEGGRASMSCGCGLPVGAIATDSKPFPCSPLRLFNKLDVCGPFGAADANIICRPLDLWLRPSSRGRQFHFSCRVPLSKSVNLVIFDCIG